MRFSSDEHDTRFSTFLSWLKAIHARRSSDPARAAELQATQTRPDAVSGIIYVPFRTDCDALASRLRGKSIGAAPYHAGLSTSERVACQQKWVANAPGYDIIVATTAFGMGIDKQDVRFVVHWNVPKSFEGFYQEAGRAGRDGKAAACILYYSREDRDRAAYRIGRDHQGQNEGKEAQTNSRAESFQRLMRYCEETERCRHVIVGEFFGEGGKPRCDFACDVCKDKGGVRRGKKGGLASEEWVSTQRAREDFYGEGYD